MFTLIKCNQDKKEDAKQIIIYTTNSMRSGVGFQRMSMIFAAVSDVFVSKILLLITF